MLLNQWLINKMPGTDKHNFGYSVGIYFKCSTNPNSLSKGTDDHTLVGLASKWV